MGKGLDSIAKTRRYLRRNGLKRTVSAVMERISAPKYEEFDFSPLDEKEIKNIKDYVFHNPVKISILVPAYRTNPAFFRELLDSVVAQYYPYWELVIADASGNNDLEAIVEEYRAKLSEKSSIVYLMLAKNQGISENTNVALEAATGDYIGLLDHDDVLTPDALFFMAKAIEKDSPVLLYSDEDKTDAELKTFYEPNRKKKLNLDLILTNNYICHFCVMKAEVMKELKFRKEFDGAQDFDIILRCIATLKEDTEVIHIPRILYHWRCHNESTAVNTDSKQYAYENGRYAVEDFMKQKGWDVQVEHMAHLGFYRTTYHPDIFSNRPDVGVVTGPVYKGGKITGGAMKRDGTVMYKGLPKGYSGYMHRAALMQQVGAGDVRNMKVRPELLNLWDTCVVPKLKEKNCDYAELSIAFCEQVRMLGYVVVYDPEQKNDRNLKER